MAGAPAGIWLAGACEAWPGVVAGLVAAVERCAVDGDARRLAPAVGWPEWLAPADAEDFAAWLCTPVAITDGGTLGTVGPGELVHAQTAAETRTVKIAQLAALGSALNTVLGSIMRTFMTPPYMPGR